MLGRRLAVAFLLCVSVLHLPDKADAQKVKFDFDKSAEFKKYKKDFDFTNFGTRMQ